MLDRLSLFDQLKVKKVHVIPIYRLQREPENKSQSTGWAEETPLWRCSVT